ncbi:phage major tail tube protein [Kingella kingae]|uniref:phage major tail tube protein n=1 Tax=Kingella kingae TaxID=504 RepID=UPI000421B9C0|nr:phage major tail tube protein [Kingella kingae]
MPEIEIKQEDFDGLGLVGQIKLPSGVEALEGEITWNSINPEWANKAYNPFKAAQLMVRGNLQTFNAPGLAKEVPHL